MSSSPPPSDGTTEPSGAQPAEASEPELTAEAPEPELAATSSEPELTAEAHEPELAVTSSEPGPAAAETEPASAAEEWPSEPSAEDWPTEPAAGSRAAEGAGVSALAEDLIARGAPWDSRTSWTIVLVEGVVAALIGLLFIFKPLGGSSTTLQVVGLILLAGSLITSFQLWRHHLRPEVEQLASFRSGSGVTVGLVVIVATFFVPVTDSVVAALAVVVGVGFFIFGLSGIGTSFVRMQLDVPLPLFTLVANAVLALAGLMLVLAGARGADSVDGIFNWLGVLLIAAGLALAGYAYMLRQQDEGR